jgi:hypothetical protein
MTPRAFLAACALLGCAAAQAQVSVEQPWVRTTAAGQATTGAFMILTSAQGGRLVAASSPIAAAVEIHRTTMAGSVMRMRRADALPLPAGRPVALKPGGFHLMLTGLKAPVKFGDVVPIRLVVEDARGRREEIDAKAVAKLVLQQ